MPGYEASYNKQALKSTCTGQKGGGGGGQVHDSDVVCLQGVADYLCEVRKIVYLHDFQLSRSTLVASR